MRIAYNPQLPDAQKHVLEAFDTLLDDLHEEIVLTTDEAAHGEQVFGQTIELAERHLEIRSLQSCFKDNGVPMYALQQRTVALFMRLAMRELMSMAAHSRLDGFSEYKRKLDIYAKCLTAFGCNRLMAEAYPFGDEAVTELTVV